MSQKLNIFILIPILLLGFALRLHNLDGVLLRGDEAFSAMFWAEMPISQSLSEIATIEPHPPLTYVTFHMWNLIIGGIDSPFALRMLDVLTNIIGIAAMYGIGKHLTGKPVVGLLSALLWAVHPFEIWHSQDFRNYAVWAGLSAITLWLGLRLISYPQERNMKLYFVLALITALTFYTELLTVAAFGLFVIIKSGRERFTIRFIRAQTIIITIVMIGFVILQGGLLGGGGYGGNVQPFNAPDYLTRFLPTLLIGDSLPAELTNLWLPIAIAAVMLFIGVYTFSHKVALFIFIMSVVPLVALGIISTRISIFHPRYVMSTIPAFILLLSVGSYGLAKHVVAKIPLHQHFVTILILSPWFILSTVTLNHYYSETVYQKTHAWDELGTFLNDNVTENDLVIQLSTDAAFGYYYSGQARDIGLPESPIQPEGEIIETLESAKATYDSIYIVSNAIPDWQNANVVESWANQHMQPVRLSNASGLGIRQYKDWNVDLSVFQEAIVTFDETVALLDYQLFPSPLPTGEIVLWLYWQPIKQTNTSLKSFVHLVGDINPATGSPLWAQDDQFPQDGRLDTALWDTDTIYRDVYYLQTKELQMGEYQIYVGWYNPDNNTRLTTTQDTDSYLLTSLNYPEK